MNRLLLNFAFGSAMSLGAFAFAPASAFAGELPDPTRPPAALRPATTGPAAPAALPAAAPLVLQSVLIGDGRKPTAIINGRVLELGESLEGLRLVRVFDGGAQLAGPSGATTLALTPGTEKVAVSAPARPLVAMTKGPAARRVVVDASTAVQRAGESR